MNGSGCTTKVIGTWMLLKWTYGLLFVVAGADKFFNMVTMWSKYVGPLALQYIPLEITKLIMVVGGIEIAIGLLILSRLTHFGAHLAALWLVVIVGNLLTMGYPYDVAVRDLVMAVGALALACLSKAKDEILKP